MVNDQRGEPPGGLGGGLGGSPSGGLAGAVEQTLDALALPGTDTALAALCRAYAAEIDFVKKELARLDKPHWREFLAAWDD